MRRDVETRTACIQMVYGAETYMATPLHYVIIELWSVYPKEEGTNDASARHHIVTGSAFQLNANSFRGNPPGLYCSSAVCSSPPANGCGTATSTFHFEPSSKTVRPTDTIDVFRDRTYPAR